MTNTDNNTTQNTNFEPSQERSVKGEDYKDRVHELTSKLKEQEKRVKELEQYKLDIEARKEKDTLYSKFMFSNEEKKQVDSFVTKYSIKDYKGFLSDFNSNIINIKQTKDKLNDLNKNYFNDYTMENNKDIVQEVANLTFKGGIK